MKKNNTQGFTITELMVAIGLSGVVLLGAVNVMTFLKVQSNKAQILSESSISNSLGNRFLWIHFKSATPSFNLLRGAAFADDNGLQFYDYCPDYPSSAFTSSTRKVTLSPTGRTTFVVMVLNNIVRDATQGWSNILYADPVSFYNITGNTFSSAQLRSYLLSQNPKMVNGQSGVTSLIDFYSPAIVRNLSLQNSSPPAMPNPISMVVRFDGTNFNVDTFGGLISYSNALTGANQFTLDQFIRELPPAGGGIPPFMLRSVRLLRYEIVNHDTKLANPIYDLRYTEWDGSNWVNPIVVASNVLGLTLTRPDITDVLIATQLEINENVQATTQPQQNGQ